LRTTTTPHIGQLWESLLPTHHHSSLRVLLHNLHHFLFALVLLQLVRLVESLTTFALAALDFVDFASVGKERSSVTAK
jgi:hypothetical protein